MTDGVVLITTSPIPSHPSTAIIDQTIASVRERCEWPIVIVADGVRPEQRAMKPAYEHYLARLREQAVLDNAQPYVMMEWQHQAGAVAAVLKHFHEIEVLPELLMMVEHDTPLVGLWPMEALCAPLLDRSANVVRSYHEKVLQPEHAAMLLDQNDWWTFCEPVRSDGSETSVGQCVNLYQTRQWSQRPHLARTDYYRRILRDHFPPDARTMIEDKMHSVCSTEPWDDHRVWLWLPSEPADLGTQRSDHLDGRGDQPKYEMKYA